MPCLTRATPVRDAVERAALSARLDTNIAYERVHGPSGVTRFASVRLAFREPFGN
jgi:hypothetical protein